MSGRKVWSGITDGSIVIRPSEHADSSVIVAGRDEEFHRWMGPGVPDPKPTACILVENQVVGWVDYARDGAWLEAGEVNVGYYVSAPYRGRGYATRAVQLLMHHLALEGRHRVATLLIDPDNRSSLAVAARAHFVRSGTIRNQAYFKRPIPALRYHDGVVTIRRQEPGDLDRHLEAVDEEQIRWLWLPEHREPWEAMAVDEQRAYQLRHLRVSRASFGSGPHWRFSVDGPRVRYVAYVDCNLANDQVPAGEANVSYVTHPAHRGRGYATRAVNLICSFLRDHTAARQAHLIIDADNVASRGVARSLGAVETERWQNEHGRTIICHLLWLSDDRTTG